MLLDRQDMTGAVGGRFLVCQRIGVILGALASGKSFESGVKGLRKEVFFRRDQIALAGGGDRVDPLVRKPKTGVGFLKFKFQELSIILIQLLQKSQIVLNVRFAVKLIFREQDGELCLNADGGGKRLFV